MIHNKYFEILTFYLEDYKKEIYGRELINIVNLSQKSIALAFNELEQQNVLKSRKAGNLKYFRLNLKNNLIKDIITIAEINKKIIFLKKERKFSNTLFPDKRIVGIFGSYAKKTYNSESDIDIFIVGPKKENDYDSKGKLLDLKLDIKYFKEGEFKKLIKKKNPLIKEIIQNHIMLFGFEKFINIVWRNYYGLD